MSRTVTVHNDPFAERWQPRDYLRDYYTAIDKDERVTIRFLTQIASYIGPVPTMLEFGCGPTVHHLLPFATLAGEIHVADYLEGNLAEVEAWAAEQPGAHDWSPFGRYTLECETGRSPTRTRIGRRLALTRRRITAYLRADARLSFPLIDVDAGRRYPLVVCCFCPDSITDDIVEWERCATNIAGLVAPRGWFVMTALHNASSYRVGADWFPSARVGITDVARLLDRTGLAGIDSCVSTVAVGDERAHGFDSILVAVGRRQ